MVPMLRQEVALPFVKEKVPVVVDFENHPAIEAIARWDPELKRKIEEACFADYRDKVASIGPESLPRIRRPNEVWKHLEFRHVRIDPTVKDTVVIYVVPDWDEEEHMEWCIRGTDQLIYVGQFLGYPVNGYRKAGARREIAEQFHGL
jgi:PP-loop superfamily ATP-utilizing enzyme